MAAFELGAVAVADAGVWYLTDGTVSNRKV